MVASVKPRLGAAHTFAALHYLELTKSGQSREIPPVVLLLSDLQFNRNYVEHQTPGGLCIYNIIKAAAVESLPSGSVILYAVLLVTLAVTNITLLYQINKKYGKEYGFLNS